jgi:hypothetical protein
VAEVESTLASIYSSHGRGAWKSKLMVKDAIADITLQQVLTRAKDFDVIATLNLNGASGGVRAGVRACGRVWAPALCVGEARALVAGATPAAARAPHCTMSSSSALLYSVTVPTESPPLHSVTLTPQPPHPHPPPPRLV